MYVLNSSYIFIQITAEQLRSGVSEKLVEVDEHRTMLVPSTEWHLKSNSGARAHIKYKVNTSCLILFIATK